MTSEFGVLPIGSLLDQLVAADRRSRPPTERDFVEAADAVARESAVGQEFVQRVLASRASGPRSAGGTAVDASTSKSERPAPPAALPAHEVPAFSLNEVTELLVDAKLAESQHRGNPLTSVALRKRVEREARRVSRNQPIRRSLDRMLATARIAGTWNFAAGPVREWFEDAQRCAEMRQAEMEAILSASRDLNRRL